MHIDDKLADMYSLHVADNRLVDEPIITEDMAQHLVPSQCCSTCRPLRRKLQDSFVRMQNGARLEPQQAQQAAEVLITATMGCQQASSSSSGSACSDTAGSSSSLCLLMDTKQLSGSLSTCGVAHAKARMAPPGQKRAANGTSLPWNVNFGANAPLLIPRPARVWDLLLPIDSSTSSVQLHGSTAGAADQTSMPDLCCIRSRSGPLMAVALACHSSSSSSSSLSDTSPPSTSTSALARLFPTPIVCRKKGNRLQGERLMLYPFVCFFSLGDPLASSIQNEAAAVAVNQKRPRTQLQQQTASRLGVFDSNGVQN